jgi:hypothetical protein
VNRSRRRQCNHEREAEAQTIHGVSVETLMSIDAAGAGIGSRYRSPGGL